MSGPELALRVKGFKPSPTIAMNRRAAEMRAAGRDAIALSLGEPDFPTPAPIKAAGIAAIEGDFTKYTAADGYGPLKQAITAKLERDNGLVLPPDQVVVGNGAKIILLAALMTLVDPGDEVIIPAPYWVSYPELVGLAGGTPVFAPCDEAAQFKLTPGGLEAALSPRTKAIIFNSPNNPSGAVYTGDEIRALAAVLERHPGVWIVTDELYEHLVYDNRQSVSFARAAPALASRVITVNGFSKGYVMTGWRLAFAAADKKVIKAMADLLSQMQGAPGTISQAAGIEALNGDQSFLAQNRRVFQDRRNLIVERARLIPGLSAVRPSGTFYAYLGCAGWIGRTSAAGRVLNGDMDVAEALLDEQAVSTVPGEVFGLSPFLRVSYAIDIERIGAAMERLMAFARGLRS